MYSASIWMTVGTMKREAAATCSVVSAALVTGADSMVVAALAATNNVLSVATAPGNTAVSGFWACRTKFSHNNSPNGFAFYDLGAASAYLVLQAAALGLSTHQMAGYDQAAARAAFDIPEDYTLGAVIALGYQGEPAALINKQLRAQEIAPRERKPLSDFVFSAWGEPVDLI